MNHVIITILCPFGIHCVGGNSLKLLQDRSTIGLHEDNHSKKISPVKETESKHHDTAPFTVAAVGNHTVEISK